jgi:hypothetical protein
METDIYKTETDIYEIFNNIFSEPPKEPKSIFLELSVLDSLKNEEVCDKQISDTFEFLLNMFVFGFNKLNLSFTIESVEILKSYFASIGFKFNIEIEQFDTILFNNMRYKCRYCTIESSFLGQTHDNKPFFILNRNDFNRIKLNEFIAVYQYQYDSINFISFNVI